MKSVMKPVFTQAGNISQKNTDKKKVPPLTDGTLDRLCIEGAVSDGVGCRKTP